MTSLESDLDPIDLTFRMPRPPISSDQVAEEEPSGPSGVGGEEEGRRSRVDALTTLGNYAATQEGLG
jgi:hypothetical protein